MKNKELFCNSIMQEELGMDIQVKRPEDWKEDYKDFVEATRKFYAKELDVKSYKGISGGFGSYAQKGAEASMLRLRICLLYTSRCV